MCFVCFSLFNMYLPMPCSLIHLLIVRFANVRFAFRDQDCDREFAQTTRRNLKLSSLATVRDYRTLCIWCYAMCTLCLPSHHVIQTCTYRAHGVMRMCANMYGDCHLGDVGRPVCANGNRNSRAGKCISGKLLIWA